MKKIKTDIVIVGSGLAGLSLAKYLSELNPSLQITLISKTSLDDCNTFYAQGGIAVVHDFIKDSYEQHIKDTLASGKGFCNKEVVTHVIKSAPARLQELLNWGVELDKNSSGNLDLGLEGGHSQNRIVHHKDKTGQELETKLIEVVKKLSNVQILTSFFALDLIVEKEVCVGIIGFNEQNEVVSIQAKATVLATGGSGQVFMTTSNPAVATGDGIAMAKRANVTLQNMKYIQFHPTALYEPTEQQAFLITEAIRGFGAFIRNKNAERFLQHAHPSAELATRDIVSNAIFEEMKKEKSKQVWLDLTHLDQVEFTVKFPKVAAYCKKKGFDISVDLIPICPAAHYQCGGIAVDAKGASSLKQLYAIGECSSTGLHGSNRLASNSLLEAVVYAHDLAQELKNSKNETILDLHLPAISYQKVDLEEVHNYRIELKKHMNYAAVYGSESTIVNRYALIFALKSHFEKQFPKYQSNSILCETYNLLETAMCILSDLKDLHGSISQKNMKEETNSQQNLIESTVQSSSSKFLTTRNFLLFLVTCFLGYSFWIYSFPVSSVQKMTKQEEKAISAGRLVLQKYNCHTCHQVYGLGGYLGPDLTNVYSRSKQNEGYIKSIIHSGVRQMPSFNLSDEEMTSLLAYLKGLDATGSADVRAYQPELIGIFSLKKK